MLRVAFALWFGLLTITSLRAQPQTTQSTPQAAAQLAARISSLLPHRSIGSLDLENQSALPAAEWSNFRNLLQAEIRKTGIQLTDPSSPESRVHVTLADSAHGLLLVAEIGSGDSRQIAMLSWNPPALNEGAPRITLTKKPLWNQTEPILDVLFVNSNSQMLVLGTDKITSYSLSARNWVPGVTASLVLPRPIPRDPRGRLEATPGGFRAYIPGATCVGTLQPDLKIGCTPGNETWPDAPVRWVSDRNELESDAVKGRFYSVANGVWMMADGRTPGAESWGSDIAPIESPCGSTVIATSPATDRDSVRAYQNGTPASDPLPLPGPVTALWAAETRGEATLVVRNLQSGEYEASRLGLACSQ
jgi:hypothetical protein